MRFDAIFDTPVDLTSPVHRGAPCGLCQEPATHRAEVIPFTLFAGDVPVLDIGSDWAICAERAVRMERNDWNGVLRRIGKSLSAKTLVQGFRRNLVSLRPMS